MSVSVTLSIAGQNVIVSGDKSIKFLKKAAGLDVFAVVENKPGPDTVEIAFDQSPDDTPFKSYLSFEIFNERYCFGESDGKLKVSIEELTENRRIFRIEQVSQNRFVANQVADQEQLRIALWYSFFYFCAKRNLFSMHASCVVYKNEAVLFLGKSGTGKSTHTKLWCDNFEGATLLNDDGPIVQVGEKIIVHGSPWSGKTHCYKKLCFPLKAIVKLKQAPENKMFQLDRQKAVAALYPSFQPILTESDTLSDHVFNAMSDIILNVPVYHLDCLPDIEAAMLSRKVIFGE